MSATCPTCGGDGELDVGGDREEWSAPGGRGGVTEDGERYRIEWHPSGVVKRALFRVSTDDRVCVLQHVRTIVVQQRGESGCTLDDTATLSDIPDPYLAKMRDDGFRPVVGVRAYA